MLQKASKTKTSCSYGIFRIKIYHIYSKKKHCVMKLSGFNKNSVKQTRAKRRNWVGFSLKGYTVNLQKQTNRFNSFIIKTNSCKTILYHRRFRKKRKHFGACLKTIKHKKHSYRFCKKI